MVPLSPGFGLDKISLNFVCWVKAANKITGKNVRFLKVLLDPVPLDNVSEFKD